MERALIGVVVAAGIAGSAHGQPLGLGGPDMAAQLLFVPELAGAVTADIGYEGRLDGIVDATRAAIPETALRLGVGYLHYLDASGAAAVGGYVSGAVGVVKGAADWPDSVRFDLGASYRRRFITPDYFHWTLAAFGEVGVLHTYQADAAPAVAADAPLATAVRWALGVEVGPGLLFHLDPYVFGEFVARLGVERTAFADLEYTALFAAFRFNFDFALRTSE